MLDKVSARNDSEPKGKVPEGSISAIREKSRGEKKTCSCHKTTNMPLKSFALSKCSRGGSTNNNNNKKKKRPTTRRQVGFLSMKISGSVTQAERAGQIEADKLSGSHFQIYFHDKHLFQNTSCAVVAAANACYTWERQSRQLRRRRRRWQVLMQTKWPGVEHSSCFIINNDKAWATVFIAGKNKKKIITRLQACNLEKSLESLQTTTVALKGHTTSNISRYDVWLCKYQTAHETVRVADVLASNTSHTNFYT